MIREKNKYFRAFVIILVVMNFIKLWGIFTVKLPWVSDETGVWLVAEYIGGYGDSWISYVENSGRASDYYGILTSLVYSPFINSLDNVVISYRCCLVLNILMLAIMSFICFRMLFDWFGFAYKNALICSIASVSLSMVLFYANMIMTETVFTTWVWLVTYYFIFLIDNNTSTKHTIVFAILMILGYAIHSRCLIVWGMVLFCVILYRIVEKRWIVRPKIFLVTVILVYIGLAEISGNIQNFFWREGDVRNSTEHVASKITLIFKVLSGDIKEITTRAISLFSEFSIETCGFIIICSLISFQYIMYIFQKIKEKQWDYKDSRDLCCFVYVFGNFWAMNFCIALNSLGNLRSKWFVYTRYATPFLGVYIMFMFYIIKKMDKKYNVNRIILLTILIGSLILNWSISNWSSFLSDAKMGKFDSAAFFGYKIIAAINQYGANVWIYSIIGCIFVGLLIMLFLLKKNIHMGIPLVFTALSIFIYTLSIKSYTTPGQFSNRYWEKIDGLAECCQIYDLHNYKIKYYGSANVYLPTQLLLGKYDLECVKEFSMIDNEDTIFFSDLISEERISKWIIKLDDEEYIYIQDERLKNQLSEKYEVIQ